MIEEPLEKVADYVAAGAVAATGADLIVSGSSVFDGKTPESNARFMLEAIAAAGYSRSQAISTSSQNRV